MSKLLNEAEVRKLIPIGHSNVLRTVRSGELRS